MSKWLLATMAFALPSLALAGPHDRRERHENRQEAQQNRQEQRDDRWDLKQLENLIARFDTATSHRHRDALRQVDADLRAYVALELKETRYELSDAQSEVRRDHHELHDARGRREFQDAQHDRRDDVRDVRRESESLKRTRVIQRELEDLYGRMDRNSLHHKRALMMELLQLARAEQAQNRKEIREDRRESREDRRQARDDRY
ncbi:hypothetical protein SAMN05444354_12513 [Stigmatella aurantiaca]|uniref:Uncharacterized protein n=1 Tax=Stigmatella aurantiaca TaxID=41 RepID=A0A1H8BZJ0_STIAU|nr:hypothetical protein [Stigmatella aurantiaca]SEM88250.1 hypothetical protein SAMN05444354_12513 [Stigmatella aurantiaca]